MTPDNHAKRPTAKKAPAKAAAKKAAARTTTKKAPAKTPGQPGRPADHDAIAKRAHELYQAQGGGDHVAHWLQAERDLASH